MDVGSFHDAVNGRVGLTRASGAVLGVLGVIGALTGTVGLSVAFVFLSLDRYGTAGIASLTGGLVLNTLIIGSLLRELWRENRRLEAERHSEESGHT